MQDKKAIEEGMEFDPQFGADGLIPCVTVSAANKDVLMVAYMNRDALAKTLETGEMHYWSRSRSSLWHKGKTSGNIQRLVSLRVDCDQDCLVAQVTMPGSEHNKEIACHTGRRGCFYRELDLKSGGLKKTS